MWKAETQRIQKLKAVNPNLKVKLIGTPLGDAYSSAGVWQCDFTNGKVP